MKVLVTGASGLLGRTVAETLVRAGHDVTVLQRRPSGLACREVLGDIRDRGVVDSAIANHEGVIHLAARVSPTGSWSEFVEVNVDATQGLLDAARRSGAHRFVYVSSPAVAASGAAHVGEGALPADPASAKSHYARSKAQAEQLALGADGSNLAVTAIRPHLVWGPGDEQLVARIVDRAAAGALRVIGTGAALVDSTYVDNAADAIVAALDRIEFVRGRPLVVSNGEPRPVIELLRGLCDAAGVPFPSGSVAPRAAKSIGAVVEAAWALGKIEQDPPMTRFLAEQLSTAHWYDQRETRALLDWHPAVALDDGLERLRIWFDNQTAPPA